MPNDKSKFREFLRSETSTYWGFALTIVMLITAVAVPFYQLKSEVQLLEQEVQYNNVIATNHMSEIEKYIAEVKENSEANRQRWEEISQELAEIRALIGATH